MSELNLTAVLEPRYVLTVQNDFVAVDANFNLTLQQDTAPLAITVGLQGQKGEKGDTGLTGAQGPQGIAGVDGIDGTDGIDAAGVATYGEIYATGASVPQTLLPTDAKILAFDLPGLTSGMTSDFANDQIIVTTPGIYLIAFSASLTGPNNANIAFTVYVNGIRQNDLQISKTLGANGTISAVAINGHFQTTTPNETVEIRGKTLDVSDQIVIQEANLNVASIGANGPQGEQGLQGIQGPIGPQGNPGETGTGFSVDAYDIQANLNLYDNQAVGFSVVDPVSGLLYIRINNPGEWTNGIQFVGDPGPTGATGPAGPQGPAGVDGAAGSDFSFDATGLRSERNLYNSQVVGFTFLATDEGVVYVRETSTIGVWTDGIAFTGPAGPAGPQGVQGISAYDVAVSTQGFLGTASEWLTTLTAYGVAVSNGFVGTQADWLIHINAYGIAVQNGYLGTQAQWLQDMTAYGIAVLNGFVGTEAQWLVHINAYGRAVQNGFAGTELQWLDTLTAYGVAQSAGYVGDKASWLKTLTAYGVAVSNGFVGTEPAWLTHISAYGVAVQNGFIGTESAWLASLIGPIGPQGIQGIQGETGHSLIPDAIDLLANRSLYDTELEGFIFMASDEGKIYFRETVFNGTWSAGVNYVGPAGIDGIDGVDGLPGDVTVQAEITAATYTMLNTDFLTGREIKKVNHLTGSTLTVPSGLTNKEPCTFIQTNDGPITFAAGVGVTIVSMDSAFSTRTKASFATLLPDSVTPDLYYLTGDIVT